MTVTLWGDGSQRDRARAAGLVPDQHTGDSTPSLVARPEHPHFSEVGMAHRRRHTRGTVSVVVPTLNEAANIGWALSRLPAGIDEVILVDGRSTDGTVEAALRMRPDVKVVRETRLGKGAALRAGFAAATGDYIVMIDADGSMHPEEIALYVAYLEAGYDFVKGSRFMLSGGSDDMTRVRKVGHWPLLAFVKYGFRVRFTDLCYGFCGFRRSCLPALRLTADGFEIESELILRAVRARLRIAEVPTWELPRLSGESNLHAGRDGLRILRVLLRERFAGARHPVGKLPLRPGDHDVIDLVDVDEHQVIDLVTSEHPRTESAAVELVSESA